MHYTTFGWPDDDMWKITSLGPYQVGQPWVPPNPFDWPPKPKRPASTTGDGWSIYPKETIEEGYWSTDRSSYFLKVPSLEAKDIEVYISKNEMKIKLNGNNEHIKSYSLRVTIPEYLDPATPEITLSRGILKVAFKAKPKKEEPKVERLLIKEL